LPARCLAIHEGASPEQVRAAAQPAELEELHLHRLLVAVDGSANADLALRAAITVARRDHAALTLISVEPDVTTSLGGLAALVGTPPDLQDDIHRHTKQVLDHAVCRIPIDIPMRTILRRGKPGPQIIDEARSGNYDAILLGARGLGRVGALLGSVSHYVLHHAPVAVFVAHSANE
jgi:nucleotide-binding universal stress UspA family protein